MRSNSKRHGILTIVIAILVASSFVAGVGIAAAESSHAERGSVVDASDNSNVAQATTTDNESNVSVQNLSAPDQVQSGESFSVTATLANPGERFTVRQVGYRIAGNVLTAKWVRLPGGATETVTFNVSADRLSGLPNGTFAHGVVAQDVEAMGELAIASDAEATAADQETSMSEQASTTAVSELAETVQIRVALDGQSADSSVVTIEAAGLQGDYVVDLNQPLPTEVIRLLGVWDLLAEIPVEVVES